MSSILDALGLSRLWDAILPVLRDPRSDITTTILLLVVLVILVVIIGVLVALAVTAFTGTSRRAENKELDELRELLAVLEADDETGLAGGGPGKGARAPAPAPGEMLTYRWVMAGLTVLVFGLVLVALGVTTGTQGVCKACHVGTVHTEAVRAGTDDPHAKVECIKCHESSGPIGSVTTEVPVRIAHFVSGARANIAPSGYGVVVSARCSACHESVATKTTVDEVRGVRMAHKQPLEAGAECRDCHTTESGVVSSITVGMTPCLRCHDGKRQSTECALCHTKDVGAATRPIAPVRMVGRELIQTPNCSLCHNQKQTCDPCHRGQRMPHTELFKWYGHAREGAKDIWFNGGQRCSRCHTATRNPCTKCHAFFPGHPSPMFATEHRKAGPGACNTCHDGMAYVSGRNFCEVCHAKPYVTR